MPFKINESEQCSIVFSCFLHKMLNNKVTHTFIGGINAIKHNLLSLHISHMDIGCSIGTKPEVENVWVKIDGNSKMLI